MNKYSWVILLLIVLLNASVNITYAESESSVSITEAKKMAMKYSTEVKDAELQIEIADKARRDADTAYEKLRANYYNESQRPAIRSASEGLRAAKYNLSDARQLLENKKVEAEYKVENLYLNMLNLEKEIQNMENSLSIQADLLKIERIKLNMGMTTQLRIDQQIEQYNSLKNSIVNLKDVYQTYKWSMNRYIGRKIETPLKLHEVNLTYDKHSSNFNDSFKAASDLYLLVEQLERTINDKNKDIPVYRVEQSDVVESLELDIEKANMSIDNFEYSLKLQVKTIFDKVQLYEKRLSEAMHSYLTTKANFEIMKKQFAIGMISEADLRQSENSLEKSYNKYVKAGYDYYISIRELELIEKGIAVN